MKRIYNFIILSGIILFTYLAVSTKVEMNCIFKKFTGICCPGCGLTRGFRCILALDFRSAIYYNILSIPLFIFIIVFSIMFIYDIIKNNNKTILLFSKLCKKYYIIIIIVLVITMVINNIHGI